MFRNTSIFSAQTRVAAILATVCLTACTAESANDGATDSDGSPGRLNETEANVGEVTSAIQGGQAEAGYPAVGIVMGQNGFCSGTLVSNRTVLTAAHCADTSLDFRTGNSYASSVSHPVRLQLRHPTRDLLLLRLADPLTTIAPIKINPGPLPASGQTCTGVGFGIHNETDGTVTRLNKRSCTEIVDSSSASGITVHMGSGIADSGDSGGPLLCNGLISAATSNHVDGTWPQHVQENYATADYVWVQSVPWIDSLYANLLNRAADEVGLTAWASRRSSGMSLDTVADGFQRTSEYGQVVVSELYPKLLGRPADALALDATYGWAGAIARGSSIQDVMRALCDSAEFKSRNPTPEQFVEALYRGILERASDPAGKQAWVNALRAGATSTSVINGFLKSQEFATLHVTRYYQSLLGRSPDPVGLQTWSQALTAGSALQNVQRGIVTSTEYRARVAEGGT